MAKRKKWLQGYVPTPQGARLLKVDRNSEQTAVTFDPKTGEATATVGCQGFLIDSDGTEERVFVGLDILEKLGMI
jgi:hypothetical protein